MFWFGLWFIRETIRELSNIASCGDPWGPCESTGPLDDHRQLHYDGRVTHLGQVDYNAELRVDLLAHFGYAHQSRISFSSLDFECLCLFRPFLTLDCKACPRPGCKGKGSVEKRKTYMHLLTCKCKQKHQHFMRHVHMHCILACVSMLYVRLCHIIPHVLLPF